MAGAWTIRSTVELRGGVRMPILGLGVWQSPPGDETRNAVLAALRLGYRLVDTARAYRNEEDVGAAIRESGVPRDEVFVTTKLWNSDHGYDSTLRACDESLRRLGLDRLDLYLVHWPVPKLRGETWRAMERILAEGKARAIGVSNYTIRHLDELLASANEPPSVNQVELHPFLVQRGLVDHCQANGIQVEAYGPLVRGHKMENPVLQRIAHRVERTPAQVLIRWGIEHGLVTIPKSVHEHRIRENADVFGFSLSPADLAALDALDEGYRTSWDPTDAP
ncbi:2,5-didehydrogluconate reductase [Anaeromyxobacter dehalogenans 2CP-1]|uniref:2,5-didehydrogluconate reductase n=1 Tax=Anaeromyxobacter dehalogenans (strain ATCC BAA-258 / DSM 21875 / 2CP-1) TaxID=455488 RepID=B8J787_ANAD2|nr:aldo/keto reductase [Anaeromyxobacter dehalogenans]ACL65277.1 2,5-didehydrogluconate reductase [Anaeromyxobacter dehalogenans 2CP-1]